jgi:hypothetical protein
MDDVHPSCSPKELCDPKKTSVSSVLRRCPFIQNSLRLFVLFHPYSSKQTKIQLRKIF